MRLNHFLRRTRVHISLLALVSCAILSAFVPLANLSASTPTWKRFGTLQQARHSFVVHPIASGQAIIVGGYVNASGGVYSGTPTATCEILNADTRTITSGPAMSDARAEFASVQMPGGDIVVVSGNSRGGLTASVEVYSPSTNVWRKAGNLLIARRQHTACFVNNDEILVVGGRLANLNTIAAAEIFNIRTGQSRRIAEFPYPINTGVAALAANGRPIVFGGRSGDGRSFRTTIIYEYDDAGNQWGVYGSSVASVHSIQTLRLSDGRLLASGGTTREESTPFGGTKSVSIESPSGLSHVANMQIDRVWHSMAEWNKDSILTIGGLNNNNTSTNTADWINLTNNQSTAAATMLEAHSHGAAVSLPASLKGGAVKPRVFILSGFTAGYRETSTVEVLDVDTVAVTVPTIVSFTPTRGTSGTVMIITGTGFTGVTSVTVGGVPVRSFTVDAPNQISAVLGAGASGAVRVSTPRGNGEQGRLCVCCADAGYDGCRWFRAGSALHRPRRTKKYVYPYGKLGNCL